MICVVNSKSGVRDFFLIANAVKELDFAGDIEIMQKACQN